MNLENSFTFIKMERKFISLNHTELPTTPRKERFFPNNPNFQNYSTRNEKKKKKALLRGAVTQSKLKHTFTTATCGTPLLLDHSCGWCMIFKAPVVSRVNGPRRRRRLLLNYSIPGSRRAGYTVLKNRSHMWTTRLNRRESFITLPYCKSGFMCVPSLLGIHSQGNKG